MDALGARELFGEPAAGAALLGGENGRAFVTLSEPRMYSLVANESVMAGALTLLPEQAGLAVYAFTFVSCAVA